MGLEFLARVRRSTLGLAAIAALALATYRAPLEGLAFALGAAWSLVNLTLLEKLVTALTGPERGAAPAVARAARAIGGMLALFGAGGVLLLRLPPVLLLVGFLAPFAVILFKAVSTLLLESRAWKANRSF